MEFCANQWKGGHVVRMITWSKRRDATLYLVSSTEAVRESDYFVGLADENGAGKSG
jgi:hypothetical protein